MRPYNSIVSGLWYIDTVRAGQCSRMRYSLCAVRTPYNIGVWTPDWTGVVDGTKLLQSWLRWLLQGLGACLPQISRCSQNGHPHLFFTFHGELKTIFT